MVIEIPFTDEWMDAPEPVYQGGKPLWSLEQRETLEERAVGVEERLRVMIEAEVKKLQAKVDQARRNSSASAPPELTDAPGSCDSGPGALSD